MEYKKCKHEVGGNDFMVPTPIQSLNYHCLAAIFKYLPLWQRLEMETVCKKWKQASELAWDDITELFQLGDELYLPSGDCVDLVAVVKRCGIYLKTLTVSMRFSKLLYKIMPVATVCCPNLLHINIDMDDFEKVLNFKNMFQSMRKLKYLEIHNYCDRHATDDIFGSVHTKIEKVVLSSYYDRDFIPQTFGVAVTEYNSLYELSLKRWTINKDTMKAISTKATLKFLNLSGCFIESDLGVLLVLENLESLDLSHVDNNMDDLISNIWSNCKELQRLNIDNCEQVRVTALEMLGKIEKLEKLSVNNTQINDLVLSKIKKLKDLECEGCTAITDTGIKIILHDAPSLMSVNVFNTAITMDVVEAVAWNLGSQQRISFNLRGSGKMLHDAFFHEKREPPREVSSSNKQIINTVFTSINGKLKMRIKCS